MSGTRSSDDVRGAFLRVLDRGVDYGDLTRGEAMDILAKVDDWAGLLDQLSDRTAEKWKAEGQRDGLRASIEDLRNLMLRIDADYHDNQCPTNAVTAASVASRLAALVARADV